MDTINRKKAFILFIQYFWKVFMALSVVCTVFGVLVLDNLKKDWLLYVIIILSLTSFISLLLLINNLIKREISDKTNISIPDQLLNIVRKLQQEGSGAKELSNGIDRYFHLSGLPEKRIELGYLLNENRDIMNQVSNLIDKLGWANYQHNQTKIAIANIIQGTELAKKNQLSYWAAKGERHLAGIELHRGNENAFLSHKNIAWNFTNKIQNNEDRIQMEASLQLLEAKYLLKNKDFKLAEVEAMNAMQKSSNDSQRQLKVYVVLGEVYLEQEMWDKAYNMFKTGYDKSNGIRNDERAKNAMGLAKLHLKYEITRYYKKDTAEAYLLEAESLKDSLKQHEKNELESLFKAVR